MLYDSYVTTERRLDGRSGTRGPLRAPAGNSRRPPALSLAAEQVHRGVIFMQQHSYKQQHSHKDAATEFLTMAASGNVREAYRKHVGADFRHHNPNFRGDAASLMAAMEENAAKNPDKSLRDKAGACRRETWLRSFPGSDRSRRIRAAPWCISSGSRAIASPSSGISARPCRRSRRMRTACSASPW